MRGTAGTEPISMVPTADPRGFGSRISYPAAAKTCGLWSCQLLENLPALDGKTVTADALHCQVELARIIAEKVGDFLLQIKANQPKLQHLAEKLDAVTPPFFSSSPGPCPHRQPHRSHLGLAAAEPLHRLYPSGDG